MKYFIISSFINALTCGFCCIFVLLNNYRSKAVKSFAFFTCLVALWSFFYFLAMLASHYDEALFYSRTLNGISIFIPPAFLNFCLYLTENNNKTLKKLVHTLFIIDGLVALTFPTPIFIKGMVAKNIFPFWPVSGPTLYYGLFQYIIILTISFILLVKTAIKTSAEIKKQFLILILSLGIAFLGGGTNYFLCLNIDIAPYGNAFVSLFIFGMFFLFARYQLMDIRIALSRSFAYTIIIFLISLSYFSTTYLIEVSLKGLLGYKSFLLSILCATITALAFVPIKDKIQEFIDHLFFKKTIKEIEEENKLLKQEVTQSERLRSIAILASGIAHEIKNPLTPLKTFSEYLPHKIDDKEFLTKFSPIVTQEVARIDTLVHELLDFAKPSPVSLNRVHFSPILENTLEVLSNDFIKRKINVIKNYTDSTSFSLNLDANQFKQGLLNIFLNAIDAMPNGGILTIATQLINNNQTFQLRITDTGCGIDPKDIPHIFDPFFTKKDHGTGLGLSVTYEIVKNHNGKIFVESLKGTGTTFIIELPL